MEAAVTIRLGYQIPNFTYPGVPVEDLFDTVIAQAREAEAAGVDTVLLMDHFYQLPGIGTPDNPMLEAYTSLGALATATTKVQLGTLVTGNTYRHPAVLAKTVTTLDVASKGRAILGIGAGWYELEHDDFGIEFGSFTDRFEKLEESLTIITGMLKGEQPTFAGKWYSSRNAMNNPRIRPTIPIMLGGSGEQKTFRLAARFADHMNIICAREDIGRKIAVLKQRCEEIGRDPATLPTTWHATVVMAESEGEAKELLLRLPEARQAIAFVGTPDQVTEQIQRDVLDQGADGLTFNLIPNGYVPGAVTMAGEALKRLVA
jgi:F420-dependent oxidoreductase-like protein